MNKEHFEILKKGVDVWNTWREKNPDSWPDLKGANLKGENLTRANLEYANLEDANLEDANLEQANLKRANLRMSELSRANLKSAILSETNLMQANLKGANLKFSDIILANLKLSDLTGADLSYASLGGVDFANASLSDIDLTEASISMTQFSCVNLSKAKGLEKVIHHGRSYIDTHTLDESKGGIPVSFLRGCGVSDNLIEYLPSITGKAIEYYSCFISYSSKDEAFAKRLYSDLQNSGVRCWYAPEDMKIGDKIRPTIDNSIRIHDKLLIILSESSVASEWVEHEVEHALDLERQRKKGVLFPVRMDDAVMESNTGWAGNIRRSRHIGDFTQWKAHDAYQESFERLLRDLKSESD